MATSSLSHYPLCNAVKLFPHSPADLTLLLDHLDPSQPETTSFKHSSWQLRYILLLWMSLVVQLPFDLNKWNLPGAAITSSEKILEIALIHMKSTGKDSEAASVLASALCSRSAYRSSSSKHLTK